MKLEEIKDLIKYNYNHEADSDLADLAPLLIMALEIAAREALGYEPKEEYVIKSLVNAWLSEAETKLGGE